MEWSQFCAEIVALGCNDQKRQNAFERWMEVKCCHGVVCDLGDSVVRHSPPWRSWLVGTYIFSKGKTLRASATLCITLISWSNTIPHD